MPQTINSGLSLTIPSAGETNWSTLMAAAFQAISGHDHTGGGKGSLLTSAALADDIFNDLKIKLRSAQWLRSRNAADSADLNLIRSSSTDHTEITSGTGKNVIIAPGATNSWQFNEDEFKYLAGNGQVTQKIAKFDNISAPSSPASGSILLYSESGTLKYKTSGGTVRVITFT